MTHCYRIKNQGSANPTNCKKNNWLRVLINFEDSMTGLPQTNKEKNNYKENKEFIRVKKHLIHLILT